MIAKLIVASLLVGSLGVGGGGQARARSVSDGSTSQWPHMHQCALHTVSKLAIKTKGTGAQRNEAGSDSNSAGWGRIDLRLVRSLNGSGGPTITAHAINTKGTGGSNGRDGVINQNPIGVDCTTSAVTGDEAAQKAAMASFAFMPAAGKGVGWACSVSGSEEEPVFHLALLVPSNLERAQSTGVDKSASWNWGESNSHLSIIARRAEHSDNWHIACSSKEHRNTNYDLAVLTKS